MKETKINISAFQMSEASPFMPGTKSGAAFRYTSEEQERPQLIFTTQQWFCPLDCPSQDTTGHFQVLTGPSPPHWWKTNLKTMQESSGYIFWIFGRGITSSSAQRRLWTLYWDVWGREGTWKGMCSDDHAVLGLEPKLSYMQSLHSFGPLNHLSCPGPVETHKNGNYLLGSCLHREDGYSWFILWILIIILLFNSFQGHRLHSRDLPFSLLSVFLSFNRCPFPKLCPKLLMLNS